MSSPSPEHGELTHSSSSSSSSEEDRRARRSVGWKDGDIASGSGEAKASTELETEAAIGKEWEVEEEPSFRSDHVSIILSSARAAQKHVEDHPSGPSSPSSRSRFLKQRTMPDMMHATEMFAEKKKKFETSRSLLVVRDQMKRKNEEAEGESDDVPMRQGMESTSSSRPATRNMARGGTFSGYLIAGSSGIESGRAISRPLPVGTDPETRSMRARIRWRVAVNNIILILRMKRQQENSMKKRQNSLYGMEDPLHEDQVWSEMDGVERKRRIFLLKSEMKKIGSDQPLSGRLHQHDEKEKEKEKEKKREKEKEKSKEQGNNERGEDEDDGKFDANGSAASTDQADSAKLASVGPSDIPILMKRQFPQWDSHYSSLYEYHYDASKKRIVPRISLDLILAVDWAQVRADLLKLHKSESHIKKVIEADVRGIVDGLISEMDRTIVTDELSTDTTAFMYLYAEYDTFTSDERHRPEDKLVKYPQIVPVMNMLAEFYASSNDFDIASDLCAQSLDIVCQYFALGTLYTAEADILRQWKLFRHFTARRRLSRAGQVEFLNQHVQMIQERLLEPALFSRAELPEEPVEITLSPRLRRRRPVYEGKLEKTPVSDENEAPAMVLGRNSKVMTRIDSEMALLRKNRFEKIGSIVFLLLLYFLAVFLIVYCFLNSSCSPPAQMFVLEAHSLEFNPSLFQNAILQPCERSCGLFSLGCTCDDSDLSCSAPDQPGSQCICKHPSCDRCNFCGVFRMIFRHYFSWILFSASSLNAILMFLSFMFVKYPDPPLQWDVEDDTDYYMFREELLQTVSVIVATEGANPEVLSTTLKHLLEMFRPNQIVVLHYGLPASAPFTREGRPDSRIYKMCHHVTNYYYSVNSDQQRAADGEVEYAWVGSSSRMLATHLCLISKCRSEHVMLVSDYLTVPRELFIPVNWFREDSNVSCLSFSLRSAHVRNPHCSLNLASVWEDTTQKLKNASNILQSRLGSVYWPSEQISLWLRNDLLSTLEEHNGGQIGEHRQLGMILHLRHLAKRIKEVGNVPIPVLQTSHLVCCPVQNKIARAQQPSLVLRTILGPLKCQSHGCKYKRPSFFAELVSETEAAYKYVFQALSILLFVWNRNVFILKFFILRDLLDIMLDFLRIPMLAIVFSSYAYTQEFLVNLAIMYCVQIFLLALIDVWLWRHRADLRMGWLLVVLYPILRFTQILLRQISVLYAIVYLIPRSGDGVQVKNVLRVPVIVDGRHVSLDSKQDPQIPEVDEVEYLRMQPRHIGLHGLLLDEQKSCWTLLNWDSQNEYWKEEEAVISNEFLSKKSVFSKDPESTLLSFALLAAFSVGAYFLATLTLDFYLLMTIIFAFYIAVALILRWTLQVW
eukprot:ANDGO_00015.mRNA.1 hypothetical protein